MRDELDIRQDNILELSPLIPEPPNKRVEEANQSWIRSCWNFFSRCSRWTCLFFILILIIIILIIVRQVLPFGWLDWIPELSFSSSDPHIILIVADDLGWQDVSYGGSEYVTSTIDSLVNEGIILDRMYVGEQDASSRASLLTGQYGYRLGLQNGISIGSQAHIPTDATLLPQLLSETRNYETHLIGKWNLGYSKWEYTPTERGFDSFLGYHQSWTDYWQYTTYNDIGNEKYYGWDLWSDKNIYDLELSQLTYSTEFFAEEIVNLIDDHAHGNAPDRPIFIMYSAPNPHTPIQYHISRDECSGIDMSIRKNFCNNVQALDQSMELIINSLKENNMWDRSLVIFLSDNGGSPCFDVGDEDSCSGSVNMPLRGGRSTLFEGGVRVRSFLSGGFLPEEKRGIKVDTLMHTVDLFPTILSAANFTKEQISEYNKDGIDHYDYLVNNDDYSSSLRSQVVIEVLKDDNGDLTKGAIISGSYKYIIQPAEAYDGWWTTPTDKNQELPSSSQSIISKYSKIKKSDEKNNDDQNSDEVEYHEYLFNINEDVEETNNLFKEKPEIVASLRNILLEIIQSSEYISPQESSIHESSGPNNFDGIWYPFEEKYN